MEHNKFSVYLVEYNTSMSFYESYNYSERKIFFSDEKLKNFLDNNLIFNANIQKIEVEDVKLLEYELI